MSFGAYGEELACSFLGKKGYVIITRNYHSRFGEIDIVAKDNKTVVFVEVKARKSSNFGTPLEAIDRFKLSKIIKTSQFYLNQYKLGDVDYRFDAVEVLLKDGKTQIDHIKNITQ